MTNKLNDVLIDNNRKMNCKDALKIIYGVTTDLVKSMLDLESHQSGKRGTQDKPKLDSEVQSMLNVLDWEINFQKSDPFTDENVG